MTLEISCIYHSSYTDGQCTVGMTYMYVGGQGADMDDHCDSSLYRVADIQ